ncbi:hypothetical protein IAT38_002868 [Cryptococcus sp. DSM 104549]
MEDKGEGSSQGVKSPKSGGISLPTRQASVTVLHQVDEDVAAQSLSRRDSLETTKSFYNTRPTSPPNGSIYRPASISSRLTGSKSRARSNSHISSQSRSATPSGALSPTSPKRNPVPLPTPKGFLSPKKPAAALKLEQRGRYVSGKDSERGGGESHRRTSIQTESAYDPFASGAPSRLTHRTSNDMSMGTMSPDRGVMSLDAALSISGTEAGDGGDAPFANIMGAKINGDVPNGPGGGGGGGAGAIGIDTGTGFRPSGWDRSLRHSLTTASSPPRTHPLELSSDDLVRRDGADNLTSAGSYPTEKSRNSFQRLRPGPRRGSSHGKSKSSSKSTAKSRGVKKYEAYAKANPLTTYVFGGRVVVGGDTWYSIVACLGVLLAVSGVWLGTTGAWMWVHGAEYGLAKGGGVAVTIIFVYLFGLTISSFVVTALRDPGIVPRGLDLDPPMTQVDDWWEAHPRELTVNGGNISVKYCETCESYRPPRSSHCRLCGNCVDGIDHHCSYLHTCVGKRNYFSFLVLLTSASISDIYIVIFSAIHFSLICRHEHVSFRHALKASPGAAVSFLLGLAALAPILFLLQYHLRLLLYNLTTLEQIRANASNSLFTSAIRPSNPFAEKSTWANIVRASIGRPQHPSWINPSGWERVEGREVNPALTVEGRKMGREWA